MSRWKVLLAFGALTVLFLVASNMSYEDAVDAHSLYCEQVFGDNPIYPDYKNMGKSACEGRSQ